MKFTKNEYYWKAIQWIKVLDELIYLQNQIRSSYSNDINEIYNKKHRSTSLDVDHVSLNNKNNSSLSLNKKELDMSVERAEAKLNKLSSFFNQEDFRYLSSDKVKGVYKYLGVREVLIDFFNVDEEDLK